jgi:hypothetical protein
MASSIINSDDGVISGTSGIKTTGGDDGSLKIQANGVDAINIASNGTVALSAGALPVSSGGTGITSFGTGVATGLGTNINTSGGFVTTDGSATLTNKTLTDPAIIGTILEDVYTIVDGAGFEIDPGNGSIQLITLGASRTPKATNFAAGESVTLMVDDGAGFTITWTDATFGGSGVIWETNAGVAPTLSVTGFTTIVLWKVSTQVYGARVGDA